MIPPNMNNIDRGLRLVAGLALLALGAFGPLGWWGAIGCPYRHRVDRLVPGLSVIGHQYLRPLKRLTGFSQAMANGSA
jgi:hypothetical protein